MMMTKLLTNATNPGDVSKVEQIVYLGRRRQETRHNFVVHFDGGMRHYLADWL